MKKNISIVLLAMLSGLVYANEGTVVAKRESGDSFHIANQTHVQESMLIAKRESGDGFYIG